MDLKAKTCCFTGHRNLSSGEKLEATVRLRKIIEEQIKAGVVFYGAGGALGFDTLAAQTVLDMKKEHPQLRLILVLPCEDQTKGWRSEDIAVYEDIKRRSDNTNSQLNSSIIHCLPVMLEITWLGNVEMVSHKRSTTFSRVAKTSLRNPRLRISFQICSMGFISGVYGGMWKRTIFSGNSSPVDLCHAAPSQQSNMISSE